MHLARVLIVDDEPEVRATLAESLTAVGYLPFKAERVGEAIAMIGTSRPDAILLDIAMPSVHGMLRRGRSTLSPSRSHGRQ
jgi:DNA-binding response OmpR family regulator